MVFAGGKNNLLLGISACLAEEGQYSNSSLVSSNNNDKKEAPFRGSWENKRGSNIAISVCFKINLYQKPLTVIVNISKVVQIFSTIILSIYR